MLAHLKPFLPDFRRKLLKIYLQVRLWSTPTDSHPILRWQSMTVECWWLKMIRWGLTYCVIRLNPDWVKTSWEDPSINICPISATKASGVQPRIRLPTNTNQKQQSRSSNMRDVAKKVVMQGGSWPEETVTGESRMTRATKRMFPSETDVSHLTVTKKTE